MQEETENEALAELLDSIEDRRIRRKVLKLIFFGTEAVRSLGELDSALYTREGGEDQIQLVADAVLSHARRLLEYVGSVAAPPAPAEDEDIDLEFDLGASSQETALPTDAGPMSLLDRMAAIRKKPDDEKWGELAADLDTLQYGLGSELREFDRRFRDAIEHDRLEQALRDLNDATSSLMDGMFALITSAYERFLGRVDRDQMIPGYRDTLGKALAVRRSLASLRQEVQELNQAIQKQATEAMVLEMSYKLMVDSLVEFLGSDEFAYLRSSDRKDFEAFAEVLVGGNPKRNRLDCEGFDKYLDSLAVVSQRDVLIKHDNDLKAKLSEELDAAITHAATNPQELLPRLDHAFEEAEGLLGLIEALDTLLYKWSSLSAEKRQDSSVVLAMAEQLKSFVYVPKAPPPPADGDFF